MTNPITRPLPPDAVAFAQSTAEVAAIMRLAAKHGAPVVPFGTGTSLEGHVAALQGGISIDLGQMNKILAVNEADLDCRVEAGVTRKQLNEYHPRPRAVLSRRSRRQCLPGRHGGHPRLGHQCGPLRHHARERAGPDRRAGRRLGHPDRRPGAQIRGGLRPHPALRRIRRDAGRHHRDQSAPLWDSRGDVGGGLRLPAIWALPSTR